MGFCKKNKNKMFSAVFFFFPPNKKLKKNHFFPRNLIAKPFPVFYFSFIKLEIFRERNEC